MWQCNAWNADWPNTCVTLSLGFGLWTYILGWPPPPGLAGGPRGGGLLRRHIHDSIRPLRLRRARPKNRIDVLTTMMRVHCFLSHSACVAWKGIACWSLCFQCFVQKSNLSGIKTSLIIEFLRRQIITVLLVVLWMCLPGKLVFTARGLLLTIINYLYPWPMCLQAVPELMAGETWQFLQLIIQSFSLSSIQRCFSHLNFPQLSSRDICQRPKFLVYICWIQQFKAHTHFRVLPRALVHAVHPSGQYDVFNCHFTNCYAKIIYSWSQAKPSEGVNYFLA